MTCVRRLLAQGGSPRGWGPILLFLLGAGTLAAQQLVAGPGTPSPCTTSPLALDTLATGLSIPWDVAFLPDGRALVTERTGSIRLIDAAGRVDPEPWAVLDVFAQSESGLMGIDARPSPDVPGALDVYVTATIEVELGRNPLSRMLRGASRSLARAWDPDRGQARYMRVYRLREVDGVVSGPEIVVDRLPSAHVHAGGAIRLGPDGMLYVSKGDAGDPRWAQDPESTRGKILRYTPDGAIPPDNPFPGSPVWASGARDSQGLAWHPETAELFAIEHGPSGAEHEGFRVHDDELSAVPPGANLGWPLATGYTEGGGLTSPVMVWTPSIAPGGLTFYDAPGSAWTGSAFVTALRGASLRRLELEPGPDGWRVVCEEVLLRDAYARLRLVRQAPDGTLWVGTSNRDQSGIPREGSDLILRLHPPTS